jgi:flavodoxin I
MKAVVIYDSRYGNTEKIATDIAKGLKESHVEEASTLNVSDISDVGKLSDFDLIAVGGPTEFHRASPPMREFLSKLKHVDLKGKYGFAFDTKLDSWWAGDASNAIEHGLRSSGAQILMPKSSAIVKSPSKDEK